MKNTSIGTTLTINTAISLLSRSGYGGFAGYTFEVESPMTEDELKKFLDKVALVGEEILRLYDGAYIVIIHKLKLVKIVTIYKPILASVSASLFFGYGFRAIDLSNVSFSQAVILDKFVADNTLLESLIFGDDTEPPKCVVDINAMLLNTPRLKEVDIKDALFNDEAGVCNENLKCMISSSRKMGMTLHVGNATYSKLSKDTIDKMKCLYRVDIVAPSNN